MLFRLCGLADLRLSLVLPFQDQGLATGFWLSFTGQGFPAEIRKFTNDGSSGYFRQEQHSLAWFFIILKRAVLTARTNC